MGWLGRVREGMAWWEVGREFVYIASHAILDGQVVIRTSKRKARREGGLFGVQD